jgi:hypothetical protein
MTVVLRGISSRASGSGTTISLTQNVPSLANGDIMLLVIYGNANQATPAQPPAGWTLVDGETSGANHLQVWSKTANSEPGSYTIDRNTGVKSYAAAIIAFYSDAGKTLYVDAHANLSNASSTNRTFPGVTTTQASAGLACFMNGGSNQNSTPPGDMTERWDELADSSNRIYAMTRILTSAGATGDKVATNASAMASRTVTVAVAELPTIPGTANITLAAITLAASGTVPIAGTAAITLAAITSAAVGVLGPLVPATFSATASDGGTIELEWVSGGGPATDGYSIERSANGVSGWTEIATTASLSYEDTGLSPGSTWFYRIRAFRN